MPDIAKTLKTEIARIARKEMRRAGAVSSTPVQRLRHTASDLKRRVALLEEELRALRKTIATVVKTQPVMAPGSTGRVRITAKGMRSLRRRLRLTAREFATLLGITEGAVWIWERATGPLRVRQTTRAAILAIRDIGAREARRRLEDSRKAGKI